jgi:hypothetical protein
MFYYINLMETLTKFYTILITLLLITNGLVTGYVHDYELNPYWSYYSYFLTAMFLISFYILKEYHNYIYFYLSIIFTALTSLGFIMIYGNIGKGITNQFLISFLLFLSLLTYIGTLRFLYHTYSNYNNQPKKGVQGEEGWKGLIGEDADTSLTNYELCIEQLYRQTNNQIIEQINETQNIDINSKQNYFNNMYLKDKFKQICKKYL